LAKKWVAPFAIKEAMKSEINPGLRKTTNTIKKRAAKVNASGKYEMHLYTASAIPEQKYAFNTKISAHTREKEIKQNMPKLKCGWKITKAHS